MAKLSSLPASQRTKNYGPFVPTPRYIALPFESPKFDNLYAHDSRVNREDLQGHFCGSRIITMDEEGVELDARIDSHRIVVNSKAIGSEGIPAEVLPGEEICADNIIRRSTTAEALGYDKYHAQLEGNVVAGKRVSTELARLASRAGTMVTWFKDYALLHEQAQEVAA